MNKVLINVAEVSVPMCMPPPFLAELEVKVQLVSNGVLERLAIPPPEVFAVLSVKLQLVRTGELLKKSFIPPPEMDAELDVKLQLVN